MRRNSKKETVSKTILTTGDIARYCETSVKQVNRWIQGGMLEFFQNPGGHYRIIKEKFREFLVRHNMPVREEFFSASQKRILIADDDTPLMNAYAFALKNRFRDVIIETASDGYEALIKTGKFNPDLLILDIRMPRFDGLEVCRRLRGGMTDDRDIKILVITAHSSEYDRETVLSSGADEFLVKPVPLPILLEKVERLL